MNSEVQRTGDDAAAVERRLAALESAVAAVQQRNSRVECDKAWEVSRLRTACIALPTYFFSALMLYVSGAAAVWLGAVVPMAGYLLSRLTLPLVRSWWSARRG